MTSKAKKGSDLKMPKTSKMSPRTRATYLSIMSDFISGPDKPKDNSQRRVLDGLETGDVVGMIYLNDDKSGQTDKRVSYVIGLYQAPLFDGDNSIFIKGPQFSHGLHHALINGTTNLNETFNYAKKYEIPKIVSAERLVSGKVIRESLEKALEVSQ